MSNLIMREESFQLKYEAFIIGCDAIEESGAWDKETLGEMEAFYANDMISIILRIIASDGKITENEVRFLNESFGFQYTLEELSEVYASCAESILVNSFDENFENGISRLKAINCSLANAYKELLALICDIIIESDGVIAPQEVAEVEKLKLMCL